MINKEHCIVDNGFSPLVQSPGLYFCIVVSRCGFRPSFGVHMRHGSPAGQFWRDGAAVRSFDNINEAREFIDRLAGLVDAHKQFPVIDRI